MKKVIKSVLAIGITALIAGCGEDKLVDFSKDELNPFIEKGFELIKAEGNNTDNIKFYSPETLQKFDNEKYKSLKSKDFKFYDNDTGYQYMIFSVDRVKGKDKREIWALKCEDNKVEKCKVENVTDNEM